MAFSKKDFLLKARARFAANQKTSGGIFFTAHSQYKMRQYGLSEQRVKRVIRSPKRIEEGIVKDTVAVMQPGGTVKRDAQGKETWSQEIWVMYVSGTMGPKKTSLLGKRLRVVSAWRYPGVSPKRDPIPEDVLRELSESSIFEEE